MHEGTVFGRPGASSSVRQNVMQSASLNAIPSPADPANLVENPTLQHYYRLYESCGDVLKAEKDALRRLEIERFRSFCDNAIVDMEGADAAGPPGPLQPSLAQAAGAPPAGGAPPPQMAAPPPVPSGGTPPAPVGS
jgi:hypothetical protein